MLTAILNNQIAMAMGVLVIIVVGAFITLDAATIKEVIVQVITAVSALVTGQLMNSRGQRTSDRVEDIKDKTSIEVAKVEAAAEVKEAKEVKVP